MKRFFILPVMLLLAVSAYAADVSGKWIAEITNPAGAVTERIFTVQVANGKLTGTLLNQSVAQATFEQPGKPVMSGVLRTQSGKPVDLIEGQAAGDDLSFVVISRREGNEIRTIYTGKVVGDVINFKVVTKYPEGMKTPGGTPAVPPAPQDIVAKRVAN